MRLFLLVCFIVALAATVLRAEDIDGKVFVVTKAETAIRLRLVPVSIYPRSEMDAFLAERAKAAKPVLKFLEQAINSRDEVRTVLLPEAPQYPYNKYDQAIGLRDYVHSIGWYFHALPKPLQVTKTDVAGSFEFKDLPPGSYVITASATREVGETTEHYHWMVKADAGAKVQLANDNLCSSDSVESLVHAPNIDARAIAATKGRDALWLSEYIAERTKAVFAAVHATEAAEFRKTPGLAERRAAEEFPDLKKKDSALNVEFVKRYQAYRAEKPEFFTDPRWPIVLAEESAAALRSTASR